MGLLNNQNQLWKGNKFTEMMETDSKCPDSIHVELLGQSVVSRSIAYLDNGVVIIGSELGDSEIVRLKELIDTKTESMESSGGPSSSMPPPGRPNGDEMDDEATGDIGEINPKNYLTLIEKVPNIGPILDTVLINQENTTGQCQLLTCSGDLNDGSLRVLRSGIGIHEHAVLPLKGIKAVFPLNLQAVKMK